MPSPKTGRKSYSSKVGAVQISGEISFYKAGAAAKKVC